MIQQQRIGVQKLKAHKISHFANVLGITTENTGNIDGMVIEKFHYIASAIANRFGVFKAKVNRLLLGDMLYLRPHRRFTSGKITAKCLPMANKKIGDSYVR